MKQVEAQVDTCISANSLVDWYNFCRDICVKSIQSQDVQKIGDVERLLRLVNPNLANANTIGEHGGKATGCLVALNEGMLSICF